MFEFLEDLKYVAAKIKSGDYFDAGHKALDVAKKALLLIQQIKDSGLAFSLPPDPELDAVVAELTASRADPKNVSLPEVILLVKAMIELIKWLRNR